MPVIPFPRNKSSPKQMTGKSHEIKLPLVTATDTIQIYLSNNLHVCWNKPGPDGLGKSGHVVIHLEVSASRLRDEEMSKAAVKSQVVLI